MDLDVERCAHCHRVLVRNECPVCVSGIEPGQPSSRYPRARSDHPPSMHPPSIHPASLRPSSMPPRGRSEHPPSLHPDGTPKSAVAALATLRPPEIERSPWWGRAGLLVALLVAGGLGWARCGDRPAWRPLAVDVDGPKVESAPRVLFFLHGDGQGNGDVAWIAPALRRAGVPADVSIVFVQAPYASGLGREWGETTADRSVSVNRVLEAVTATLGGSKLTPDRVFIAGFAQGAQIANDVAADERFGALALLSPCARVVVPDGLKILVTHGDGDRDCHPGTTAELVDDLKKHRQDVTFVTFAGEHVVAPEAVDALATLVGAPLEGESPTK